MSGQPEDTNRPKINDLNQLINKLQDTDYGTHNERYKHYKDVLACLQVPTKLDRATTERLLAVCVKDLTEDLQYSSTALFVLSQILSIIQEGRCEPQLVPSQLVPSAITVIHVTKNMLAKPLLRNKGLSTILLYPAGTLKIIVSMNCNQMFDLLDYHRSHNFQGEITEKMTSLIVKILQAQTPEEQLTFVRLGIDVWLKTIIPGVIHAVLQDPESLKSNIRALELLTENLKEINYSENPAWHKILVDVCEQNRYPAVMKNLLEIGNEYWHRLWMVFITLLKDDITKVNKSGVSPINALLPVVETAFKMNIKCRTRAFECWNVLIDNLSSELNESMINKRLKLLIIPLKLNNAKVESTVSAKFNTWWRMVSRFHNRIDKMADIVLIPFLQFCFGKRRSNPGGNCVVPGQINETLARRCVEALVEMFGHVDCEGCCSIPSLRERIISPKLLVERWDVLTYSVYTALRTAARDQDAGTDARVRCLWKGFVKVISELPENQIRADLFIEVLKLIESLLEVTKESRRMADIIWDVLLSHLLSKEPQIRAMLKTKGSTGPLHLLVRIVQSTRLLDLYKRFSIEKNFTVLTPLTDLLLEPSLSDPHESVPLALGALALAVGGVFVWAALAESVCTNTCYLNKGDLLKIVLWPFKIVCTPPEGKAIASAIPYSWYSLYTFAHPSIGAELEREVEWSLRSRPKLFSDVFTLAASLALLRHMLVADNVEGCERVALLLKFAAADVRENDIGEDDHLNPILTDVLILFLNKVIETVNVPLAENACLFAVKVHSLVYAKRRFNSDAEDQNSILKRNFYETLNSLVKIGEIKAYEEILKPTLATAFELYKKRPKENSPTALCPTPIKLDDTEIKVIELSKCIEQKKQIDEQNSKKENNDDTVKNKDEDNLVTEKEEHNSVKEKDVPTKPAQTEENREPIKTDFTAPEQLKATKKSAKKQPNIVNTVVENGEEFAVIKSHWKFNPKNLTENQKEKLKRKREDIPALYQDLSQSQDEFKLVTWKTDSQDASTTSSKSESNDKTPVHHVADVLKSLPSTEVVPKIIENILTDGIKADPDKITDKADSKNDPQKTPTPKRPKTPRLALKDRVFRNVRNLIEKSGVQGEVRCFSQFGEDMNRTIDENELKTPVSKVKPASSTVNSAPPKISSDRPARSIKKPKKFEDTEIFALKKKRRSQGSAQPDSPIHSEAPVTGGEVIIEDTPAKNDDKTVKINDSNEVHSQAAELDQQKESPADGRPVPAVTDTEIANTEAPSQKDDSQPRLEAENVEKKNDDIPNDRVQIEEGKNLENEQTADKTTHDNSSEMFEDKVTPKKSKKKVGEQTSAKKKRSRIEQQLLIDMVEGHPVLQSPLEKRSTRKKMDNAVSKRGKSLIEKSYKIKAELINAGIVDSTAGENGKPKSKSSSPKANQTRVEAPNVANSNSDRDSQTVVLDSQSQDQFSQSQDDIPMSEDVIESSQDSTLTTISVKSTQKKVPVVRLAKDNPLALEIATDTQHSVENLNIEVEPSNDTSNDIRRNSKDDIELPVNKTMPEERVEIDLTENMDTEPIDSSEDVIVITDDLVPPIVISQDTAVGKETQEFAEADTLPMDGDSEAPFTMETTNTEKSVEPEAPITRDDATQSLPGTVETGIDPDIIIESSNTGSPFKDDDRRKTDFLNDTIEISPIKILSPLREEKSPTPEKNGDFVVIKLTSPVRSDGEPFGEKGDSPEVFTEEKGSPDARDRSPPRREPPPAPTDTSPSSSLSLKKNRPQMRFNGRAAQMLGLCVPENRLTKNDDNDGKTITAARRNLKGFSGENAENGENGENVENARESEKFLRFTRALPPAESSPANPILKRKLVDVTDDGTGSPASKRKRVSFHDPPVSTTVAVQKYIDPSGVRSPSNSALRRHERQQRVVTNAKSPKRLESLFRLDTVLTRAADSFADTPMSLDVTPAAEIVDTSDLNDTDPICPELLDCKDSIENIASELSSPSTKALLVKELEGKVETIADLARMTELEINRLCIKAPKVTVARKVLNRYAGERARLQSLLAAEVTMDVPTISEEDKSDMEVQTDLVSTRSSEMQTIDVGRVLVGTQTEGAGRAACGTQTTVQTTREVIDTCLDERPDFVEQMTNRLSEILPPEKCLTLLLSKMTTSNCHGLTEKVLSHSSNSADETNRIRHLKLLQEHLLNNFDSKSLILFCSKLLQKIPDKMNV